MKGIIYMWTNKINEKSYIGQTTREAGRIIEHMRANRDCEFHHDIQQYGIQNFEYTVLERDIEEKDLNNRERYYVKKFKTNETGYNKSIGGDYGIEHRHRVVSQETKDKLSTAAKARKGKFSEETRKKMSESSKRENLSAETLQRYHDAHVGKKHSEETKQKISESHKKYMIDHPDRFNGDKNPFYGKTHSEEVRRKLSESHKGKPTWNKGKHWTEEQKQKMKGRKGTNTGKHRVYHEDGSYTYEY